VNGTTAMAEDGRPIDERLVRVVDFREVQQEVQEVVDAAVEGPTPLGGIERFALCEAAHNSYAVVLTSERRLYGNFLLIKGVVPPDA